MEAVQYLSLKLTNWDQHFTIWKGYGYVIRVQDVRCQIAYTEDGGCPIKPQTSKNPNMHLKPYYMVKFLSHFGQMGPEILDLQFLQLNWQIQNPFDNSSGANNGSNELSCYLKEAQLEITVPTFIGMLKGGACEARNIFYTIYIYYIVIENKNIQCLIH